MTSITINIQPEDFDMASEYRLLTENNPESGAVVTFTGLVRDKEPDTSITALEIEHYPGMTELLLNDIAQQAVERWPLSRVRIIHRIGRLARNEQIVFVGVTSAHRAASFDACQFIMDYLKQDATFWKKELFTAGERWVEAKASDRNMQKRWSKPSNG